MGQDESDTVSSVKCSNESLRYICGRCPTLALVEGKMNHEEDAGLTQCRPSPRDKENSTLPPGPESPMAESQCIRRERC